MAEQTYTEFRQAYPANRNINTHSVAVHNSHDSHIYAEISPSQLWGYKSAPVTHYATKYIIRMHAIPHALYPACIPAIHTKFFGQTESHHPLPTRTASTLTHTDEISPSLILRLARGFWSSQRILCASRICLCAMRMNVYVYALVVSTARSWPKRHARRGLSARLAHKYSSPILYISRFAIMLSHLKLMSAPHIQRITTIPSPKNHPSPDRTVYSSAQ